MNILFLTLLDFTSIEERGIYTDLMREFVKNHHHVYIISPTEKRKQQPTRLIEDTNCKILKLQIGNIQKTNMIEKGISILTLEGKFQKGIQTYFSDVCFDLVIYSTPPITLQKAVRFVKDRDHAKSYLLLKDIFPQNAVDLKMLQIKGVKGLLYQYFRWKEKKLYATSDYIGCMSEANVEFVLQHNQTIRKEIVEICPNSIEPIVVEKNANIAIRTKYNIPLDKTVFIYGGNLGKPQGIDFLIRCLKANQQNAEVYFVIVGAGTEFYKLQQYFDHEKPNNAQLFKQLPKEDYDILANCCDVGLIFLDYRFTIPNFPSRLLSYMQASMPVLAATDMHTDIGQIIEQGEFGYWCESTNVEQFNEKVQQLCNVELRERMGQHARKYLEEHYTARHSYEIIMHHFQ